MATIVGTASSLGTTQLAAGLQVGQLLAEVGVNDDVDSRLASRHSCWFGPGLHSIRITRAASWW